MSTRPLLDRIGEAASVASKANMELVVDHEGHWLFMRPGRLYGPWHNGEWHSFTYEEPVELIGPLREGEFFRESVYIRRTVIRVHLKHRDGTNTLFIDENRLKELWL